MRKHIIALTAITLVGTAVLAYLFLTVRLTPTRASTQSIEVDRLFAVMFAIASFFLVLVVAGLLYSVIAFRRREGDMEDGPPIGGHMGLETAWLAIPLAVVIALSVAGALVLHEISRTKVDELEVRVTAFQFGWQFEYPEERISAFQLRLPVNRPVRFVVTSRDVVHNFWVPEWRVKQDTVPGMEHTLRITPTEKGNFWVLCNELCGVGHTIMRAPVAVVDEEDFQEWIEEMQERERER